MEQILFLSYNVTLPPQSSSSLLIVCTLCLEKTNVCFKVIFLHRSPLHVLKYSVQHRLFFQPQVVLGLRTPLWALTCICLSATFPFSLSLLRQIMEVRRQPAAATGRCEGGSGHCGKEESAESLLSPARCCSGRGASAASSCTSPTGCRLSWLWPEGAPMAPSRWTASMCGTPSGESGERLDFFSPFFAPL